ncbi:hypothetical protein HZU73_09332 [Apis mellifera caucasica]|uniref:Uncharacterized protein LOC102654380 n=1 Tax=Apis mellifera TaxID=7460 RepID=A0A7M7IP16_APIME|nr:uncharacterized protein LOC102654380 [Apis mellifera]KAG6795340.1 hypothetical protein HZU73_09332 [Apis mellifera caucasica]KAG9437849.1 hypothetical protein HZU67_00859 [Apis mellifera carnica]|eukprot:XP_016773450.1 uncharacterized protein LOC102654380 [Apis mellifera]
MPRRQKRNNALHGSTGYHRVCASRTLYAIQNYPKEMKHQSYTQLTNYNNNSQETYRLNKFKQIIRNSSKSSTSSNNASTAEKMEQEKEVNSISSDNALIHKIHPIDHPLRNNVPEREKCTELDDILAKWNVYKPKK